MGKTCIVGCCGRRGRSEDKDNESKWKTINEANGLALTGLQAKYSWGKL